MRIVHWKKEPYDVYIGRPGKWGNPYIIGPDGTREEVIEKYEEWVRSSPTMMRTLHQLKGKVLGCWCDPGVPCHGEVLLKLMKEQGIE